MHNIRIVAWLIVLPFLFASASISPALAQDGGGTQTESERWHEARTRELALAFQKAYNEGDWEQAIRAGYDLAKHDPRGGRSAYNLACAYALDGKHRKAAKWIDNAAREGYANPDLMLRDPDLEPIRDDPRFKSALEQVRRNRAHDFEQFKSAWERLPMPTSVPEGGLEEDAPVIVALHGFGSDSEAVTSQWESVAEEFGALLVAPVSGRASPDGGGYQWTSVDEQDWIIRRAIERSAESHGITNGPVVLVGFSQGATVAVRFAMKYPERIDGVVSVSGLYDPELMPFNRFKEDVSLPRFSLLIGSDDPNVQTMREAKTALESRDAAVRLEVYEGLGHAHPENAEAELATALRFVLRETETKSDGDAH